MKYCHDVQYVKTTMVWLSDGEKFLKIQLLVLTEFTNVTDGQTAHDGIGHACISSHGKNTIDTSVCRTVHTTGVCSTASNSSIQLLSYLPDNHQCTDAVHLMGGTATSI